jgi:hypothetical protein
MDAGGIGLARRLLKLGVMTPSLLLFAALSADASSPAATSIAERAEPAPSAARPHHLSVTFGVGAPTGLLGVSYDRDLSRRVQLGAGAGLGLTGLQIAAIPRLMLRPSAPLAFFVGAGPSISLPVVSAFSDSPLVWGNAEIGLQVEGRRTYLQLAIGATVLAAGRIPPPCFLDCSDAPALRPGYWAPTARLAAGARF